MDIDKYGVILNVSNFDDCVHFYKSLFKLKEIYSKVDGNFKLICLEFGTGYLMIETGGIASSSEKNFSQNPVILRFNVNDIESAYSTVLSHDKNARLLEQDWGTIIRCTDPDGNPISIRDAAGFLS